MSPSIDEPNVDDPRTETVSLIPNPSQDEDSLTWWDGYRHSLDALPLSVTAKEVIERDSLYILEHGVLGAGPAGTTSWPDSRVRRGLVMGAVQSGKTASMLGVCALALDRGVDAVIILAGTRISLWKQTFERLASQLDPVGTAVERDRRRVLLPGLSHLSHGEGDVPLNRLYALNRQQVRRALGQGRPVIAVVMKNIHHIRSLAATVRQQLLPTLEDSGRDFHLLVLDDEADDGSILDARVESGLDPASADLKQIPRTIVDLWEKRPHSGASASSRLFVTYVGYTATPQANFLQSDHNPLSPKDFVVALRTPMDSGRLDPRATTYYEPEGLSAYYTGGEAFYGRATASHVCIPTSAHGDADVADALRAFLVAGAIRLWRDAERLRPSAARSTSFPTREEAAASAPRPHSMLFHPSPTIEDHFDAAASVIAWAGGLTAAAARTYLESGERALPAAALSEQLLDDEEPWAAWLRKYRSSSRAVREAFDLPTPPLVPTADEWPEVRDLLINEVLPATRVAIVNSDPRADDRPQFEPTKGEGGWLAPRDLSTIFISGNVMSRGLTLEGLTTTLFLRHSDDPYADTQMQMQRWFGYRGRDLHLSRVFLPEEQLALFRAYHDGDEALRRDVIQLMNETKDGAPDPKVLQGRGFQATGKITNLRNVPLCPGASPFVRLMNDGADEDPNVKLLSSTFTGRASHDVVVGEILRGRILDDSWNLTETAGLLDGLRYGDYKPGRQGWQARRWEALQAHIGLDAKTDEGLLPLYRPPEPEDRESPSEVRSDCPYALAAYLRLWQACLSRHARGIFPTDDPRTPWSMVDLAKKMREQPRFFIAIRYGSGEEVVTGKLGELPFHVRPMKRAVVEGQLVATWGSRNPGGGPDPYLGDAFFDYHVHDHRPPSPALGEPAWRPPGAPGLVLFHVVERENGRPTVAVGLALPLGGPDQFAARSPSDGLSRGV